VVIRLGKLHTQGQIGIHNGPVRASTDLRLSTAAAHSISCRGFTNDGRSARRHQHSPAIAPHRYWTAVPSGFRHDLRDCGLQCRQRLTGQRVLRYLGLFHRFTRLGRHIGALKSRTSHPTTKAQNRSPLLQSPIRNPKRSAALAARSRVGRSGVRRHATRRTPVASRAKGETRQRNSWRN
jgi:hypothetical protein